MKIAPQDEARSMIDSLGSPPMSFSESPFEIVRFQYFRFGNWFAFRCFWILSAMARPIDPRPIHPSGVISGRVSGRLDMLVPVYAWTREMSMGVYCSTRCKM
jgi:hypothetical protein